MSALDVAGKEITVGCRVVRGVSLSKAGSCGLEIKEVTKVIDDKVYLDGSGVPMKFNDRLAVI